MATNPLNQQVTPMIGVERQVRIIGWVKSDQSVVAANEDTPLPVSGTFAAPVGGATAAKQPALGTAGTASADVITVQGIASGTTLPVTNTGKQYTGVPSSFAFRTANETVFTLAAGEVGFIQNCDDAALAVKKGASCSPTSLSMILKAGAAADDGSGGYTVIKDWVGAVSVAAMSGTARYLAWKQAA